MLLIYYSELLESVEFMYTKCTGMDAGAGVMRHGRRITVSVKPKAFLQILNGVA